MYLNILKKDLKRKKAMNVILLVFVILATMFVSSSVSNILTVTTSLDRYMDMANAPDYFGITFDKALEVDIDEILASAPSIDSYSAETVLVMSTDNIILEPDATPVKGGSHFLQSDDNLSQNYFLSDHSILKSVPQGQIYVTVALARATGLEAGDKVTIEIKGIRKEFTVADAIRDAALGAGNINRYIINSEDFEAFTANDIIKDNFGGSFYYIHTSDLEATQTEISEAIKNFSVKGDRAYLKFTYVFDMMLAGILLVVSIMLIAIAFVVLRFTITFTLSEEFREIGVLKAIGIPNLKIRGLYLVKYAAISLIGAAIGLALSFPFGDLMMSVTSTSIIMSSTNPFLVNFFCSLLVIGVILLFCFGCTGKVKKMTPIDAIRNGQTGERFRKKSLMSLGRSKFSATGFLATNDIVSSPRRYSIMILTFFLCLSMLLILSATVYTMKSGSLNGAFGWAKYHVAFSDYSNTDQYMVEGGRETMKEDHAKLEKALAEKGIPAICHQMVILTLPVTHGETEYSPSVYQGTGATMDLFEYTEGTPPQHANEIAITRITASKLNAGIGDTVTITTLDGDQEYIISAYYQAMQSFGEGILLHVDAEVNYAQTVGATDVLVLFPDDPGKEEVQRRMDVIRELYPQCEPKTCAEIVSEMLMVTDAMDAMKYLVAVLTILLTALVTVLMERSFIAKEKGEIALMKAIGTRNSKIYAYHTLRFTFVGLIAVIIGEIFAMPLTHLCIDPIFKMMGMELAVDYMVNPVEMYLIFPGLILVTTAASAFLTALYTRKIKSSDTANIE
jgi:putative ABC transport system permease protein